MTSNYPKMKHLDKTALSGHLLFSGHIPPPCYTGDIDGRWGAFTARKHNLGRGGLGTDILPEKEDREMKNIILAIVLFAGAIWVGMVTYALIAYL